MAVANLLASLTGNAQQSSLYGANVWYPNASLSINQSQVPVNQGTNWLIWQIQVVGIPTGEAFNGIVVSGNNSFGVLPASLRQASLFSNLFATLAGFTGQGGNALQVLAGNSTPVALNATVTKAGFTSTDIANGTMLLGVAASTNNVDPGSTLGDLRWGARTFTVYTGPDTPNPVVSKPSGTLANPAGNISPGVFPGTQFAALTFTLTQPLPQAALSFQWSLPNIPAGLTFAANGLTSLTQAKGTGSDPTHPYDGSCGAINVARNYPLGVTGVALAVTGFGGGVTYNTIAQLVVRGTQGPPTGMMWMEV